MTPQQFRQAALAMPDVVEGSHHDHPDFRAHGRVIASLHPDGEHAMVRVAVAVQQQFVARHAGACKPANGAWGRAGCTMLLLAAVPLAVVRDALAEAWQFGAIGAKPTKPKQRPAKRSRRA